MEESEFKKGTPGYQFRVTVYDYGAKDDCDRFEKDKLRVFQTDITRDALLTFLELAVEKWEGWGICLEVLVETGDWVSVMEGAFDPTDPDSVRRCMEDGDY